MEDIAISDHPSPDRIKGKECGNGVVIDHFAGWQSQYCHLRRGSILVKAGDHITGGSPLGLVGLSGWTEFPHLHFNVRYNGQTIDPFTATPAKSGCRKTSRGLWASNLEYEKFALYNWGFAIGKPDIAAIRNGQRADGPLSATAPALVVWADMLGVKADDRVTLKLTSPDKRVLFNQTYRIYRTQARRFIYGGIPLKARRWPAGIYKAEIAHTRFPASLTISELTVEIAK
jgi:hypothetical protein